TSSTGASSDNSSQYAGRDNDNNGLYYYRNRYYSPDMGRFISEDPIGATGGINQYAYALGNPMSNIDPSGLLTFLIGPSGTVAYVLGPGLTGSGGVYVRMGSCQDVGGFYGGGQAWGFDIGAALQTGLVRDRAMVGVSENININLPGGGITI